MRSTAPCGVWELFQLPHHLKTRERYLDYRVDHVIGMLSGSLIVMG